MTPAVRVLLAAVEGVAQEVRESVLGQLREKHLAWHTEQDTEPDTECHACELLGRQD